MSLRAEHMPKQLVLRPALDDLDKLKRSIDSIPIDMSKMENAMTRKPLDEIAEMVRALTYGEMMRFAEELWKAQPPGDTIGQHDLPGMFHRWSQK